VLTTPVLRRLKEQLEGDVELHYLTKKAFESILAVNPYIDKVWTMEDSLDEVLDSMVGQDYDYVIDLHRNLRSGLTKRKLKGAMEFTLKKYNFEKWLLVNFGMDRMPDMHIVDRYLDTIKAFTLEDDGKGLDYFIPEETEVNLRRFGLKKDAYVAWVLGAAHPGKRFSADKVARTIKKLNRPVVLLGGKADQEISKQVMATATGHLVDFTGRTSVHESAWLIKHAACVVTPDTGMMHIASAFGKRIISLWGCTVPAFGMYPYRPGGGSEIIEPQGLSKRPCSKLGDRCKYPGNCIEQIDEDRVIASILNT
jgi:ADP-heptose:LPS heptosyltransferase